MEELEFEPCPFCGGHVGKSPIKNVLGRGLVIFHDADCWLFNHSGPRQIIEYEDGEVVRYTYINNLVENEDEAIEAWNTRSYIRDYAAESEERIMGALAAKLQKAKVVNSGQE